MNTPENPATDRSPRAIAYPALVAGLLLAVLIAGAFTTVTALHQGFTPIGEERVAPIGH